ncbi:MAG: DUF2520 domain-containing protein, partial [Flavobacteriaceae bacterium]|nr:DUF2520 domain-containing protein [Flavobacteriaceae bacterium]
MIKVSLIGAGNLATHLFKALDKSGEVVVIQWYNRSIKAISSFSNDVEITDD